MRFLRQSLSLLAFSATLQSMADGAERPATLVSLEAENAVLAQGWDKSSFYTSVGLRAKSGDGFAEYRVSIENPGDFQVYLLGARRTNAPVDEALVAVDIAAGKNDFKAGPRLRFRDSNATSWTDLDAAGRPGASLNFPYAGEWILRLRAERGEGFYLDKLVLVAGDYVPTGTGPLESTTTVPAPADSAFDPMVVLPPAWAFGVLYGGYTDQAETLRVLDKLAAGDYPVDAYWIDSWFWDFAKKGKGPGGYLSFQEDRSGFPDVGAMWSEFKKRGIKSGVWIWDCILREGNEAVFDEFQANKAFSEIFIERNGWHNQTKMTISGNIDFDRDAAVALWRSKMEPLFAKGLDFFKIDRSSAIPFTKAAFEASQSLGRETKGRGFVLAHVHTTYDPRLKSYPTKWSGDAQITWTQPGYPDLSRYAMGGFTENIGMVADPKRTTYAIPFLTHDAGGYDIFNDGQPSEELYTRWLQFAAMNTVMTIFSYADSPTRNHPYSYSEASQESVRRYLHLRMRLFPYIYTYALDTRLTGRKMVQGDGMHEDQYLFGHELLVAPVHQPGATSRQVYLPEGEWFEWEGNQVWAGGRTVSVDAPLAKLPLFVRAGAIVPMRDYAHNIEGGSNEHLTLQVYPGAARSSFTLREDDGTSNDYLDGGFASTAIRLEPMGQKSLTLLVDPVDGAYQEMPAERRWTVVFHHQSEARLAQLNGSPINAHFDAEANTLTVEFRGARTAAQRLELR